MSVMTNVKSLIGDEGVTYDKHYCTVAWCCPSRVNFFTGRAAHNTNVTALTPPYGGYPKFIGEGLNDNYLPVWLQEAGVRTYYAGKFMNAYSVKNRQKPYPNGWHDSSFLVDPWTYNYHHSHWVSQPNASKIHHYPGVHTTYVTKQKALDFLDDAAQSGEQFFLMVAPVAPHAQIGGKSSVPPPPDSEKGNFLNAQAPRGVNWNPDDPSGVSWIKKLPKLTASDIQTCDANQVGRLQNIAGIDDLIVGPIIDKLKDHNILDNTYVIYTTDNGFHIGNHRLMPGKRCPYEEDINIPLVIRGPGMPKGVTTEITNSHTDLAPTILQMLGVPLRPDFDGAPIAYTESTLNANDKGEHVNVEFWDGNTFKPKYYRKHNGVYANNTYKALRMAAGDHSLYYSVWCTNQKEFYNMDVSEHVFTKLRIVTDIMSEGLCPDE